MTQFSSSVYPTLPSLSLSPQEQQLLGELNRLQLRCKFGLELSQAYYLGEQIVRNLRIAVPSEVEDVIDAAVGWGAMAVDPYVARVSADCYRLPTETDGDPHLAEIMRNNGFAAEQGLAVQDALSMGRAYWMVGSPAEADEPPVVTVESPLTTSVLWDLRGRGARAALSHFYDGGRHHATFAVPGLTTSLAVDDGGQWVVTNRDQHDFNFVPIVRMAHQAQTTNRDGRSAISWALRSHIDGACRSLLGLEVAREVYSVPGKVILGATEDAFVKSDGTNASAWETYIHMTLGLARDEEGNLPEVHQWTPMDPSVFTKILDWYASAASGIVLSPPQDMGLYTQGNPPTAESIDAMNHERSLRAIQYQRQFEPALIKVAQYALRFENKGELPDQYRHLAVDWNPVNIPNPVLVSDGITKQIVAQAVPPSSDVVLKKLGYSDVERQRLAKDREDYEKKVAREQARAASRTIAESLTKPPTTPPASGNTAGQ